MANPITRRSLAVVVPDDQLWTICDYLTEDFSAISGVNRLFKERTDVIQKALWETISEHSGMKWLSEKCIRFTRKDSAQEKLHKFGDLLCNMYNYTRYPSEEIEPAFNRKKGNTLEEYIRLFHQVNLAKLVLWVNDQEPELFQTLDLRFYPQPVLKDCLARQIVSGQLVLVQEIEPHLSSEQISACLGRSIRDCEEVDMDNVESAIDYFLGSNCKSSISFEVPLWSLTVREKMEENKRVALIQKMLCSNRFCECKPSLFEAALINVTRSIIKRDATVATFMALLKHSKFISKIDEMRLVAVRDFLLVYHVYKQVCARFKGDFAFLTSSYQFTPNEERAVEKTWWRNFLQSLRLRDLYLNLPEGMQETLDLKSSHYVDFGEVLKELNTILKENFDLSPVAFPFFEEAPER